MYIYNVFELSLALFTEWSFVVFLMFSTNRFCSNEWKKLVTPGDHLDSPLDTEAGFQVPELHWQLHTSTSRGSLEGG